MRLVIYLNTLLLLFSTTAANVEKVIFLGPTRIAVPPEHPNLDDLRLNILTPSHWSLRTQLLAAFPNLEEPRGKDSWFLLKGLREGQRYELRICWAATQPTGFWLSTHTLPDVFENPSLISSLALYSETRQNTPEAPTPAFYDLAQSELVPHTTESSSLLFLQISSAADYFTTNKTLMTQVPPVDADIILDPYLFNIFPRSLAPTAAYIVILAVGSWFLSEIIWNWLHDLAQSEGLGTSASAGTPDKKTE
ncbi:MAG: hypothetical protein M1827_003481 [Pycnora praestabilis]|nr:MAG: hypothetical protein M1827_003481 [Pycnora praestabilis]